MQKNQPENTNVEDLKKISFREKAEIFIDKYTPNFIKRWCNKILDILPNRAANWIREHRFLTICIFYTIKGLFFRPSMWVLYAAIFAYFKA